MGRRDIEANGRRKGGLVRAGIRSVSGAVGLASESIKARKAERHNSETSVSSASRSDSAHPVDNLSTTQGDEAEDDLENEWNLDDAQDEIAGEHSQGLVDANPEHTFMQKHNERPDFEPSGRLALPVVIPQRRPKDRSRGFIRAYAPVLQDVGIDQPTWLDFLDTLHKSSAADPWLNAINLAAIGTMFMPHVIGFAVSYAIQQATNIAIEMQARFRTTTALRKLNEEFFQPRGLYCLIMTWNPDSNNKVEQVNINKTVATLNKGSRGVSGVQDKFRSSDGITYGELAFPEVAPLVFPTLDELAAQTGPEAAKKKSNVAKGMTFVANYWDKRATAEYSMQHPDSVLAQVPQGEFTSRYADPNHAAASGSLISFVSGGRLIPGPNSRGLIGGLASVIGQAARGEKQGSEWERYTAENAQRQQPPRREKKGIIPTPIRTYKKLLAKNVLYLMVVNMPSEEEMAAARAAVKTPDIQKLLATRDGDYAAACALDFSRPPAFYDTFALRDIEGHEAATTAWPYFRSWASREALKHGKPTPVESCWNGIVAMNSKPFYQVPHLTFRGVPDSLAKLHVEGSECCLIHTDNPLSREQGVWVNPSVRVGYNERAYKAVNPENSKAWMSMFSIARGLWTNRFLRWSTSPWFKERVMRRRVEQWKEKHPSSRETGTSCLINEMQILTWYGWAHV
ncbi:hypothetical protein KCU83_g6925, partial [Aureobasidium melanogenum]